MSLNLFKTTTKGLPDLNNLPVSMPVSTSFYYGSLAVQGILFLLFVFHFFLTIYRIIKKIKNSKFQDIEQQEEEQQDPFEQKEEKAKMENANDNPKAADIKNFIIYRFDDDEGEEPETITPLPKKAPSDLPDMDEKGPVQGDILNNTNIKDEIEKQQEQQESEVDSVEEYNEYHDENEDKFIQFEDRALFFSPLVIGAIICNNLFQADPFVIGCLALLIISYVLFNLLGFLSTVRAFSLIFFIFALMTFVPFFYNDQDFST